MIRVGAPCLRHACAACCHDTEMPLTEADAARLEALGHARAAFARVDDGVLRLRTRAGEGPRPCVFLDGGRCSVYADRPAGCRLYPFVLDVGDRVVRDADCPHRDEFPSRPDLRRRLARVVGEVDAQAAARRAHEA